MKNFRIELIYGTLFLGTFIFSLISGCSLPLSPADSALTDTTIASTTPVPATQNFVVGATPFQTPTQTTGMGSRFSTPDTTSTPVVEDYVCQVYQQKEVFAYNKTAKVINLIYPPMYVNYTVDIQDDVKGKYLPYHMITFRDKKTGEILAQTGFKDKDYQYNGWFIPTGFSNTIKVRKSGEYQIEVEGGEVNLNMEIWMRPENFDDSSSDIKNLKCMNWPGILWHEI